MLYEYAQAVGRFIRNRARELSSKIGIVLAGVSAAAITASALPHPWNYITFAAAIGLILFPEPKR